MSLSLDSPVTTRSREAAILLIIDSVAMPDIAFRIFLFFIKSSSSRNSIKRSWARCKIFSSFSVFAVPEEIICSELLPVSFCTEVELLNIEDTGFE